MSAVVEPTPSSEAPSLSRAARERRLFPPSLVPVLREGFGPRLGCLSTVSDEVLVHLLTTVFFAGLETYESERNPVRIVFVGNDVPNVVAFDGDEAGAAPIYRWKILRFVTPRPFTVPELVKLAVATVDERIYTALRVHDDRELEIVGIAREGMNTRGDPYMKVVSPRPGGLSVYNGRDHLVEYEHGTVSTGCEDVVFAAGEVRRRLECTARATGLDDDSLPDYIDSVRTLVHEMASHGHGGILVIQSEESPEVASTATYRVTQGASLAPLLRLSRLLDRKEAGRSAGHDPRAAVARGGAEASAFRRLLRNSFLTEAERIVEEFGALTAIDGATILNANLALVAFGVILRVSRETRMVEAFDPDGTTAHPVDLGSRGTRHRAAATYAAQHPGSVVFVASEDGQVRCMLRTASQKPVLMWRLSATDVRAA